MTREETISLLRRYRRDVYAYSPKRVILPGQNAWFHICVYGKVLVNELIQRIRASQDDPIQMIERFYSDMDFILGESDDDHFVTHRFAAIAEAECGNILRYLKNIERKKNEDDKT